MSNYSVIIRLAKVEDARDIADILIKTWRTTYGEIVSETFLNKMDLNEKTIFMEKRLSENPNSTFVAQVDEKLVEFATAGKSREKEEYDFELYAIYILKEFQKLGLGKKLITVIANERNQNNEISMYVQVLKSNSAKTFYEKLKGKNIGETKRTIDGKEHDEICYGWDNINIISKQ